MACDDGTTEWNENLSHRVRCTIEKCGDREHSPVCETVIDFHLRNIRRVEANRKRNAVEQHVARIGDEPEGVREESVQELDEHEREVYAEEQQDASRVSTNHKNNVGISVTTAAALFDTT